MDYLDEVERCEKFLREFIYINRGDDDEGIASSIKYMDILQEVANRTRISIDIELDDIFEHDKDEEFVRRIETNTVRYIRIFGVVVDKILPSSEVNLEDDIRDVLLAQRQRVNEEHRDNTTNSTAAFPKELLRRYELHIIPRKLHKAVSLRSIRASNIGNLVVVRGMIVRVTQVKPHLVVATYTCDECGLELFQEISGRTFTPISVCPSKNCTASQAGKAKGKLNMQNRGSKFVKFQEVKIQELTEHVPIGHIPRSMKVYLRGELTRRCTPGDIVSLAGVFLPSPFTGFKALRAGLIADTFIDAMSVSQHKKSYADYSLTPALVERVNLEARSPDVYGRLARSLAPEIFGHVDVKKSLLLQMVGGVTRKMPGDGLKIRGDINICLIGDPGVAKSQLLKHICTVAPRGIYTSGKGSSGVGLTAAVLKDPVTGEFVLEGGALVLADMGICCIDEFDKMEEADRTSIHEVMEQQTISIAKAGITTTLNARTSILAAANPAYGRYNPNRSPYENFNLPASLLSRFDLIFLIIDRPDAEADRYLAEHVTYVHQHGQHPALDFDVFEPEFIRSYIAQARRVEPHVPKELTDYIVAAYVSMRSDESTTASDMGTYTTARTLLGLLRLSQASARLRFSETVVQEDIDEAMRLMHMSKISIADSSRKPHAVDPMSDIYLTIRDMSVVNGGAHVLYSDVLPRILAKGRTQQQLNDCLAEYEALNILTVSTDRSRIRFIS